MAGMRALSGLMLLLVFTVLLRCGSSKPQKETPRLDVRGALDKVPLDGGVTTATLEWLRDDAGVHVDGVAVSLDADAPEGAHIRITVLDDDGGVLSKDTLVAFCVKQARKGERLVLPLDSQVRAEDNPLLQQAARVGVMQVSVAPGCLRPSLRVEKLLQPRKVSSDGGP